ncbi:MAG TPA: hypothetical protein VMT34_09110, partial [Aggregatilineales bacterium]|nr:hypothetical protein [Aggregatilineales bacterium]
KIEKKNPLSPIYALGLMLGLFIVAYIISGELFVGKPFAVPRIFPVPALAGSASTMGTIFTPLPDPNDVQNRKLSIPVAQLAFAGGLWLALLGLAYFAVTMLAGRDPEDARQIPLPSKVHHRARRK